MIGFEIGTESWRRNRPLYQLFHNHLQFVLEARFSFVLTAEDLFVHSPLYLNLSRSLFLSLSLSFSKNHSPFKSLNLTTMSREGPFMKSKTDILTSPFSVPFQEKEKMQNFICADVSSRLLQLESCKWVFKLLDAPSFIRLFVRCNKITKQKQ